MVVIAEPEVHVNLPKTKQAAPKKEFFFCMLRSAPIVPPQYQVNENCCNFFSIPSILFGHLGMLMLKYLNNKTQVLYFVVL